MQFWAIIRVPKTDMIRIMQMVGISCQNKSRRIQGWYPNISSPPLLILDIFEPLWKFSKKKVNNNQPSQLYSLDIFLYPHLDFDF